MNARRLLTSLCVAMTLAACTSPAPTEIQRGLLKDAAAKADAGDEMAAARQYRELAEAGVVQAQVRLAEAYLDGRGVDQSTDAAILWLTLAAEAGSSEAMALLGELHGDKDMAVYDPAAAARWYALAADLGDESARYALADLAISAGGTNADRRLAVESLREGALNGYVESQVRLAELYEQGGILPRDRVEAERWYNLARGALQQKAERGDTRSQMRLATLYFEGKGVAVDANRGLYWLEQASANGKMSATIKLAKLYQTGGSGVPRNMQKASEWREVAAGRNHASSAYELGKWYMRGEGNIDVDAVRSKRYFEQAASLGETRAFVYLGELHGGRSDRLLDYAEAADWYRQAGAVGDAKALFKLAELHERQLIDSPDLAMALALYEASAEGGYSRGNERAARLRGQLGPDDLVRADTLLDQVPGTEI